MQHMYLHFIFPIPIKNLKWLRVIWLSFFSFFFTGCPFRLPVITQLDNGVGPRAGKGWKMEPVWMGERGEVTSHSSNCWKEERGGKGTLFLHSTWATTVRGLRHVAYPLSPPSTQAIQGEGPRFCCQASRAVVLLNFWCAFDEKL